MRKLAIAVFLLVAQLALSVEISQDKLTELMSILKDYTTITKELSDSLQNSKTQIDALQTGFDQYKETVDILLQKAKRQECQIVWLKIGIVSAGVIAGGLATWALVK